MPLEIIDNDDNASMDDVPEEFICPISLSLMKDPVMSKDGKNFEKKAILDWLNLGNVNCPLTRQPLKPSLLAPNAHLKLKIQRWRKENVQGTADLDDDEASCSSDMDADVEFVGLLQVESDENGNVHQPATQNLSPGREERRHRRRSQAAQRRVDEDLSDLMELYNEVLELTATPIEAMPTSSLTSRSSSFLASSTHEPLSQGESDAAIGMLVAHTTRRRWRPNSVFQKS